VPFLLVVHDEDDESLAVAAASGIGADEVVVALVLEHEAGIAVREAEQGLGGVAGVVAVRGHLQHGVRVLVVFELCIAHTADVMHTTWVPVLAAIHGHMQSTRIERSHSPIVSLTWKRWLSAQSLNVLPSGRSTQLQSSVARRAGKEWSLRETFSPYGLDLAGVTNNLCQRPEHDLATIANTDLVVSLSAVLSVSVCV
jgi:hypothetical protein